MAINLNGTTGITTTGLTSNGIDDNATSTAMTLDASGNLLVSKTSSDTNTVGVELGATGYGAFCRDANKVAIFNRKTNDGTILDVKRDGTTVGTIGTGSGVMAIAGPSGNGLSFPNNLVLPATSSAGAKDASTDLGVSYSRFKDLYLSGGVYLGGTGSANKLDDYEEGSYTVTATPETSGSQTLHASYRTLTYTKIGRLVKVQGNVYISSNSSAVGSTLFSLPFASSTDEQSKSFSVLGVGSYPTPSSTSLMSASGSMRAFKAGGGPLSDGTWYSIDFTYIVNV